ncbi:MAG: YgiT-type zinc finger protein [Caldilineaceae bacterium]|nr:YgiT-type zinc finger protein [Caldilineaceae bacterium]
MNCPHCQGRLKAGATAYSVNRNGYHLIIDQVPAFICEQCHEPLFTEEALRLVQEMIRSLDEQRRQLSTLAL